MSGSRHLAESLNTRRIGKKYSIHLRKSQNGFGIKIAERDNALGTRRPIYVIAITTTGAAFRDGRLKEGDMLLEINGVNLAGKTISDVTKMLREVKMDELVEFVVSRQESSIDNKNDCDNGMSLIDLESPDRCDGELRENHKIPDGPGIYVYEIPTSTKSAGLGLYLKYPTMNKKDLGVFIEKVITGGAAWKDGRLQPDDQILAINGINLTGLSHADALTAAVCKGTLSSTIRLNIYRRVMPNALEPGRPQSARSWDEESVGEERFRRDGFGRQSISEKKHARLNAKNTDTYKRNQKLRQERLANLQPDLGKSQEEISSKTFDRSEHEGGSIRTSSPSAEELLQMLSRKPGSSSRVPPVPPKPICLENTQDHDRTGRASKTFNNEQRQQQQLYYQNIPYPVPAVTSATDYQEDHTGGCRRTMPTEMEVESISNRSISDQPSQTSIPINSHRIIDGSTFADTSTATNNDQTFGRDSDENTDNIHAEDIAIESKDPNGLPNTSALNLSVGRGLIVPENSDSANHPRNSNGNNYKMPYTHRIFEEVTNYLSQASHRTSNSSNHEECEEKIDKLEKLTASLMAYVQELELQVSDLASKVSVSTDRQVGSYNANDMTKDEAPSTQYRLAPSSETSYHSIPAKYETSSKDWSNSVQNNGLGYISTHSKSDVATISINPSHCFASTQPCNTSKAQTRQPIYSSTDSINSENLKTCGSANYLNQRSRQSMSPNSLMSISSHRDQSACSSMLPLSSNGQHSYASTQKKASEVAGSTSMVRLARNRKINASFRAAVDRSYG